MTAPGAAQGGASPPVTMATAERDYYEVLGLARDAGDAEIKRAFRQRALLLHPDVATESDGGRRFLELVAAYEVLSDPKARVLYDRAGRGRRRARRWVPPTAPPPVDLELAWYEGERGASKIVSFQERVTCSGCSGRGVEGGVAPAVCARCGGDGLIRAAAGTGDRLLQFERCDACDGRGHDLPLLCPTCDGSGRQTVTRSLRVRVPAGVRDGDLLQVDGVAQRFRLVVDAKPRDSRPVLVLAVIALACAVALLAYLLVR